MDEPAKKAVFLSLICKGTPELPRWMIADQWDRVWRDPDHCFVFDHGQGTLYANHAEAAWCLHDMLIADYKDLPVQEFEVPVRIRIYSGKPLNTMVVAAWCQKACRMLLDAHGCGYGPMDGTLGVIVADWPAMVRSEEEEGGP